MERHANKFSFRKKDCDKRREKQLQLNASVSFDYDKLSYISKQVAHEIQAELCDEYSFSTDQLAEVAGISCTLVICKVYPKDTLTVSKATLLVVCGPGFNGAVGLVCARYLKTFGYRPTIFFPKRLTNTMFENFNTQCDKLHIPCLSYMPSEATLLTSSYNLIVDALLGCNFQGPVSEEFKLIIQTMMKSSLPIVSIDIPSGWDVEKADPDGIQPDVLISLTAPKQCAASFRGKLHFLAGRFLPPDLIQKYDLTIPEYPGTEMCVELLTSVWNASQRRSADEADEVHSPA